MGFVAPHRGSSNLVAAYLNISHAAVLRVVLATPWNPGIVEAADQPYWAQGLNTNSSRRSSLPGTQSSRQMTCMAAQGRDLEHELAAVPLGRTTASTMAVVAPASRTCGSHRVDISVACKVTRCHDLGGTCGVAGGRYSS